MSLVKVILPDGSVREVEKGTTVMGVAEGIGKRLASDAVAGSVDGKMVDVCFPIESDCALEIVTLSSEKGLDVLRHTAAHVMAQAVKRLFPDVKLAIGPTIANGFYYDFDKEGSFTPEDLEKIEAEMAKIVKEDHKLVREDVAREEALKRIRQDNQPYKEELVEDLESDTVSFYTQGEFTDLCRGPHLPRTGMLKAYKLLNVAGAYWRGDEKNKMLSRIYGTAFATRKELDNYLYLLEEAARRDHRKLGKELDLYSVHEEAGAGLIFYHPKGAILRGCIEDFWKKEHIKRGYQPVIIPHISDSTLWNISGHNEFYRENMYYLNIDDQEYVLKPMNCPGHILIYKSRTRSYKELPVRLSELGTVYRYERSGALHGLLRVRGFTQDDAHLFCRPDQLCDEIRGVINFAIFMLKSFGFSEYEVFLSTRPEKSVGTDENWEKATSALKEALVANDLKYQIDPGEGVFYGPKIDIKLKDALGRLWQGPTIQVDFNLPERFDVNYIGEDGEKHRPIMIHRVVLGSIERFMGCLIEQYAGAFPVWLAPVQVKVLNISEKQKEYADSLIARFVDEGIRVDSDFRNEKIGYKIREAQLEKVPYMIVIGDKEVENGTVTLRSRVSGDLGSFKIDDVVSKIKKETAERIIETKQ